MKKLAVALLLTVISAGAAVSAELLVLNSSDYVVRELYISPASQRNWGADQLGSSIIDRAARFTVRNIPEGDYDLRLVSTDGDECIVRNVTISGNMKWMLTDTVLENCAK